MTDFEVFTAAIGGLTQKDRLTVLGDECVVYPPVEDIGYSTTPPGAVVFGMMGCDGVHYAVLKRDGIIRDDSPVIHISPMDFDAPYTLLGHTFQEYLTTVCGVSKEAVRDLLDRERNGEAVLARFLRSHFDHSRLDLDGFGTQIDEYADLLPPKDV